MGKVLFTCVLEGILVKFLLPFPRAVCSVDLENILPNIITIPQVSCVNYPINL